MNIFGLPASASHGVDQSTDCHPSDLEFSKAHAISHPIRITRELLPSHAIFASEKKTPKRILSHSIFSFEELEGAGSEVLEGLLNIQLMLGSTHLLATLLPALGC